MTIPSSTIRAMLASATHCYTDPRGVEFQTVTLSPAQRDELRQAADELDAVGEQASQPIHPVDAIIGAIRPEELGRIDAQAVEAARQVCDEPVSVLTHDQVREAARAAKVAAGREHADTMIDDLCRRLGVVL